MIAGIGTKPRAPADADRDPFVTMPPPPVSGPEAISSERFEFRQQCGEREFQSPDHLLGFR